MDDHAPEVVEELQHSDMEEYALEVIKIIHRAQMDVQKWYSTRQYKWLLGTCAKQ